MPRVGIENIPPILKAHVGDERVKKSGVVDERTRGDDRSRIDGRRDNRKDRRSDERMMGGERMMRGVRDGEKGLRGEGDRMGRDGGRDVRTDERGVRDDERGSRGGAGRDGDKGLWGDGERGVRDGGRGRREEGIWGGRGMEGRGRRADLQPPLREWDRDKVGASGGRKRMSPDNHPDNESRYARSRMDEDGRKRVRMGEVDERRVEEGKRETEKKGEWVILVMVK